MAEQGNPRFRRDGRRRDQVVENEFTEKIISVNRVSKTVKGGRHFGFSVLVCVGDQKGKVGIAIGKAKAVTATARKLAILFYRTMRFGMRYEDPGVDQYEQRYRERVVKQLQRRAAHFGFSLQPTEAGVS